MATHQAPVPTQLQSGINALNLHYPQLPGNVGHPEPFPPGKRIPATDDDLSKYGFPPKPDKATHPKEYAAWEHTVSRALQFVTLKFTPLPIPEPKKSGVKYASPEYSGATNVPVKDLNVNNYKFTQVTASWTVPRPSPQNWAFKECGWAPAEFFADSWIGIDDTKFRAGLAQNCITSCHQDTQYIIYPWYQYSVGGECHRYRIDGLVVRPGDLIRVYLRRDVCSNTSVVSFYNESAATYSIINIDHVDFEGDEAFWIVEDPFPKSENPALSYLGATNFFDCSTNQAGTDKMGQPAVARGNLDGATVLNIKEADNTLSTTHLRVAKYPQQDADILTITSEVREVRNRV